MKKYLLLFFISLFITPMLFGSTEEGCSVSELLSSPKNILLENEKNCTKEEVLHTSKTIKTTAIRKKLYFVKVVHENEDVLIEREQLSKEKTCPPFCIEPMQIKNVKTVAELEVLDFIDKLKEKKARLLIDVRESQFYNEATIPGAINLPLTMMDNKSKYRKDVLKLLGGKLKKRGSTLKWSFKYAQSLLIFGESASSNEASKAIKQLLELGYPSEKLLYYRGGISSWRALGLTVY